MSLVNMNQINGLSQLKQEVSNLTQTVEENGNVEELKSAIQELQQQIRNLPDANIYGNGVLVPPGAPMHNNMYRTKDLTEYFTSGKMSLVIADGTFSDIYIGDYIDMPVTIDDEEYQVRWQVAHLNYFKHDSMHIGDDTSNFDLSTKQCMQNHIVLLPTKPIQTEVLMHSSLKFTGGYVNTDMWTQVMPKYAESIKAAFGAEHVYTHPECLTFKSIATAYSNIGGGNKGGTNTFGWYRTDCNLMSQAMCYGYAPSESSGYDSGNKMNQLALFRFIKPNKPIEWYWLTGLVTTNGSNMVQFSIVDQWGSIGSAPANFIKDGEYGAGVRPYFCLI